MSELTFSLFGLSFLLSVGLLSVGLLFLLLFVNSEESWPAFLTAGIIFLVLWASNAIDILYPVKNPSKFLLWIFGYVGIGILWTIIKWHFFTAKAAREISAEVLKTQKRYQDIRISNRFTKDSRTDSIKEQELKEREKSELSALLVNIPTIEENKGRLVFWASYWPFSFVGTLLDDPLRALYEFLLAGVFGRILQNITNLNTKKIKTQIEELTK